MTKYREILRLHSLNLSQQSIADSCSVSKKTVNRVFEYSCAADEMDLQPIIDAHLNTGLRENP